MKRHLLMALLATQAACSTSGLTPGGAQKVASEMDAVAKEAAAPARPDAVSQALLPPLAVAMPVADDKPVEARFDLAVNNTPAKEVFAAIASGTRYNMLPLPGVEGNLTLNLRDVTLFEALDTIRALYGYDYKVEGRNIYIQPVALQTRLFKIDYLAALRNSESMLSVKASGQVTAPMMAGAYVTGTAGTGTTAVPGMTGTTNNRGSGNASSVSTTQSSTEFNFWQNLEETLKAIITPADKNKQNGERSVVINRMSGVIVVRAMPDELRHVQEFLEASKLAIGRQVIIEAKFVEVVLSDTYQSGINWAAFSANNGINGSAGIVSQGATILPNAAGGAAQAMSNSVLTAVPGSGLGAVSTGVPGSVFGLAFQTGNFGAILNFLETQGSVHVLSSPRIATLNNQKAVLKVGTDEPYAVGFTPGTTITGTTTSTTLPTPVYNFMFSGISLDVTPRITDEGEIILHVHPSISTVTSKIKDAGAGQTMQMASTNIEETDSIVRARGGQIVVIGGLMSQNNEVVESGLPGFVKSLFGMTSKSVQKRELVIMLKPTIVDSDKVWAEDIARSRERMETMERR